MEQYRVYRALELRIALDADVGPPERVPRGDMLAGERIEAEGAPALRGANGTRRRVGRVLRGLDAHDLVERVRLSGRRVERDFGDDRAIGRVGSGRHVPQRRRPDRCDRLRDGGASALGARGHREQAASGSIARRDATAPSCDRDTTGRRSAPHVSRRAISASARRRGGGHGRSVNDVRTRPA